MIETINEMLSHSFIIKAILVGGLVSLCCALLGVSLVLKRFSMIGDGLSHVGYGSVAIALALGFTPLTFSLPIMVIVAFFLLRITENGKIKGDAAIALIASSSLAIGNIASALSDGMNAQIESYLFGSAFAIEKTDIIMAIISSIIIIIIYSVYYNKIFAITFDESFAKATGTNTNAYNTLISLLTAVTIVIGIKVVGSLLISSLIIFPALTSMRVFKSFRRVVISSAIVSMISFLIGIYFSYTFDLPCGGSVVIANLMFFILYTIIGKVYRKLA